jgi:hypothetical protein
VRSCWKAVGLESPGVRIRHLAACPNRYAVVTRGSARGPLSSPLGTRSEAASGRVGFGASRRQVRVRAGDPALSRRKERRIEGPVGDPGDRLRAVSSTEGETRSLNRVAPTIQAGPCCQRLHGSPLHLARLSSGPGAVSVSAIQGTSRSRGRSPGAPPELSGEGVGLEPAAQRGAVDQPATLDLAASRDGVGQQAQRADVA